MTRSIRFSLLSIFFITGLLHSESRGICTPEQETYKNVGGKIRLSVLKNWDQFLNLVTSSKLKTYSLTVPLTTHILINNCPELIDFAKSFSYFSFHPIIANVSKEPADIELILCILKEVAEIKDNDAFVAFAIAELLAKGLSYRDLRQGQSLQLPVQNGSLFHLETYTVDRVFNLWNGMPAFGLVPQNTGVSSLLLFRGTDMSLYSKRGWASLMSDVDMSGPGLSVFMRARPEIHEWLLQVAEEDKRAIVLGFSLGGCFAAYTFLYEGDLLNDTGSIAFNSPGISESVLEEWNSLTEERQSSFVSYINRGDIISKIGHLFGPTYEISTDVRWKPLFAHTVLLCGQPSFTMAEVDIEREDAVRYEP